MAEGLAEAPLHFACWCDAEARVRAVHPEEEAAEIPEELLELAARAPRPDVFALRALSRTLEARYPDADLLFLPLQDATGAGGSLVLAAPAGRFDGDAEAWRALGEAFGNVVRRAETLRAAHEECERLRQRIEEVEAMDVIGLAANRTLDPDEVLALVARFTRTLLEADYVTVSSGADGRVRPAATVGLCGPGLEDLEDPLARGVVELGKPVYLGEGEGLAVSRFPLHAEEGMQSGFGVPLSLFGRTLGALVVGYRLPYAVTRDDTRLAVSLARYAAVAISNAELHRAVEARSAQLEVANEHLRELAGVKERFFNTMSHELRTPIHAMKGYTELLLDGIAGQLAPQAERYVRRCHASALNLLTLVDDLLDLAKLEADGMVAEVELSLIPEIVDAALASVEPQADAKGLRVVAGAVAVPPLPTDAKRVRQILTNLLSNAVKFTGEGEIAVSCEMVGERPFDEANGPAWLEIRVSDTGPGIAPENLDLIFQEYGQVPGSEGTGLGLPISRKLARLLGGDLRVESTPGAGSTFILSLPAPVPTGAVIPAAAASA
jgi:signal transduction histidine kinase